MRPNIRFDEKCPDYQCRVLPPDFDQFKKPDMLVAETVKTYFDERFKIRNSPVIIHHNGTSGGVPGPSLCSLKTARPGGGPRV